MMLKALLLILLPPVLSVSTGPGCFRDQRTDKQQNTITDTVTEKLIAIMGRILRTDVQMLNKSTVMANHIRPLQTILYLRGLNLYKIKWHNTACDCYWIKEGFNILVLIHWKLKMLLFTWWMSKGERQPGSAPHRCNTGTGDGRTIITLKMPKACM